MAERCRHRHCALIPRCRRNSELDAAVEARSRSLLKSLDLQINSMLLGDRGGCFSCFGRSVSIGFGCFRNQRWWRGELGPDNRRRGILALKALHPAASRHLIQTESRRHGSVQAWGDSTQRNTDQLITVAPGEHRQPLPLGSRDHHERAFEIDLLKGLITLLGEADHAVTGILESFQGSIQIDNPGHGEMLQGTGSDFGNGSGETCTSTLRQHHTMGTQCFRGSHDRSEIVGIRESIQRQQQWWFVELTAAIDQIGKIQSVGSSGLQRDSLMNRTTGHLSQTSPGDLLHQHSRGLGITEKLHEFWGTPHLGGAPDAMNRAPRLESRLSGMPAPEKIISHGISSMGTRFPARLLIGLAISALWPRGMNTACIAVTEATTAGTTIRETPVIGAMPLEAGFTAAAIVETPVIETSLIGAALISATVSVTAILKTPLVISPFAIAAITIAAIETTGRF